MQFSSLEHHTVAMLGLGIEARALITRWHEVLPQHPLTVLTNMPQGNEELMADPLLVAPIRLEFGEVSAERLNNFDIVIKSPGFSPYRDPVAQAIRGDTIFTSASAIWFGENPDATTICITGTKGKSTTSALLAHILTNHGLAPRLAGNIGRHMFEYDSAGTSDPWVIEMSSYQARDFGGYPSIGVVLNLYPEHLDWHLDENRYYDDKLEVLRRVGGGIGLINGGDQRLMALCPPLKNRRHFNDMASIHCEGTRVFDGANLLFDISGAKLLGPHNRANICAALSAAQLLGFDPASCGGSVISFEGLPHRLCDLGEISGISFIDDSLSTTPHATMAAIEVFSHKPLTVLVGGHDRGINWDDFADFIAANPIHAIISMPENGPYINRLLRDTLSGGIRLIEAGDLDAAVTSARSVTPRGGVVLLSPGAPSFGAFSDYKERGISFARLAGFDAGG